MISTLSAVFALSAVFQVSTTVDGQTATRDEANPDPPLVFSGRAGRLDVAVPRIQDADIKVDGLLDEDVWQSAAVMTEFTQYEPVEGIEAAEDTEIHVFYSSDAIYFGIRAFDHEPDLILARLGERDRAVFSDDWVRIMLDTFDDRRQAYVFYVNPLGIQTDGLWIEGMRRRPGSPVSIDFNPDFIWQSDGRVTDDGWTAEVRIPYVSLRFREVAVQDWGIQIARETRRNGFKQAWAPLTQNVSSTLAQSGRLVGLQDLRPRRLVEFNPVATGKRSGQETDGVFERGGFDQEVGLNARVGITQNLIFDATLNPDFSQVEADENRISVNERFALFFAEKRAFFLEGTEIFRTPSNLVHTRQIADPSGGAKVTGKIGSFNVGYLGAVDQAPKTLFDGDHAAVFNLLRLRRDVGEGSTVGMLYTDRTLTGGGQFNRVVSGDARLLFRQRYTLTTQFAGSWTSPESGPEPATFKPLVMTQFERTGRNFGFLVKFDDIHPDFRTESGFIPRVGDTEIFGSVRAAHFAAPGSALEQIRVELRGDGFFDHEEFWGGGRPFEWEVELQPTLSFKGSRSLTFILRDGFFRFRSEDYDGYEILGTNGGLEPFTLPPQLKHMKAVGFIPRARLTNDVQVNGRMFYREVPIFTEATQGVEFQVAPDVTLRPTHAFQLQLSYTYSRIWRDRDDTVFSTVNISRLRTQYQFSKALFARAIAQYNLEKRDDLRDPTTGQPLVVDGETVGGIDRGRFEGQFLLSYEPSPGTIFFIGYNRSMTGERTYRLTRMEPSEDRLFVKLSYLWRM